MFRLGRNISVYYLKLLTVFPKFLNPTRPFPYDTAGLVVASDSTGCNGRNNSLRVFKKSVYFLNKATSFMDKTQNQQNYVLL